MRRFRVATSVLSIALASVIGVPPGGAISNGVPDGDGHPNVGALIAEFEIEPGVLEKAAICSGSLISPTVFLTAGHCTDFLAPGQPVWVSFDTAVDPTTSTSFQGSFVTHPGFHPGTLFNDLSVVLFPAGISGITPAQLPTAGLLDQMKADGTLPGSTFTNVGYGGVPGFTGGPPTVTFDGVRRVSTSPFGGLMKGTLRLFMNSVVTGEGGSCFGDSGSPKFIGSTNTIVAVTSWGDAICRAQNMNWRLDIASSRDFLDAYVALP